MRQAVSARVELNTNRYSLLTNRPRYRPRRCRGRWSGCRPRPRVVGRRTAAPPDPSRRGRLLERVLQLRLRSTGTAAHAEASRTEQRRTLQPASEWRAACRNRRWSARWQFGSVCGEGRRRDGRNRHSRPAVMPTMRRARAERRRLGFCARDVSCQNLSHLRTVRANPVARAGTTEWKRGGINRCECPFPSPSYGPGAPP